MKIVNKELPVGNKFYPLEPAYCVPLESLMARKNIDVLREAKKIMRDASPNSEYWRMCESTYSWVIEEGEEEFPIITMPGRGLRSIINTFDDVNISKKSYYAGSKRIGHIHALLTPKIRVRYDPVRKGLWFYDVPYEGELVSNKPMVINKILKESLLSAIKQLAVEALIGVGDEDLKIANNVRYGTTRAEEAEILAELVLKLLSGDYETTDLATAAYLARVYRPHYVSGVGTCINLDDPWDDDIPFTPGARTKLIYHFGGYQLPDNYEEWFDK